MRKSYIDRLDADDELVQLTYTSSPVINWDPDWSPSGGQIAFESDQDGGDFDIFVIDVEGGVPINLTNNEFDDGNPDWSPDGQYIVFDSDMEQEGQPDIFVMRNDGTDLHRLTDGVGFELYPTWSPDGSQIAFVSTRDGNAEIYVMNANGNEATRLTNNSTQERTPAWSPDGKRIAFVSFVDNNWEIYVMNADGSETKRLTFNSVEDMLPSWILSSYVYQTSAVTDRNLGGDYNLQEESIEAKSALEETPDIIQNDEAKELVDTALEKLVAEAYEDTFALYQKVLDGYPNSEWIDEALFGLSISYLAIGETEAAMEAIQTLLKEYPDSEAAQVFREDTGENTDVPDENLCQELNQTGIALYQQDRSFDALEQFQRANTCYQAIGDRIGEATSLHSIGLIYSDLRQHEAALDYYEHGLPLQREVGNQGGEGYTLNNIGLIYSRLGQYEVALDYYQQALIIFQEIGDREGEAVILDNIGRIHDSLGQYRAALGYTEQALIISREIDNRAGEAVTLNNFGAAHSRLGQYQLALDYYQQALIISEEIDDREGEGAALNNIGYVYDSLGQLVPALEYLLKALTIKQQIGDRNGEGHTANNIASILDKLGQTDLALDYHQQALAIFQEIGEQDGEGASLNNIGNIYSDLEQYEIALDYYQQGLTIAQETGDRSIEGTGLNNIGIIYSRLGQHDMALNYYQQAITVFETVRSQAGSEQGRAEFIAQYAFLYRNTVDLFYQQNQLEEAFQVIEQGRARAFLDSLATGQVRLRDDDAVELLTQGQELYAQRQAIRFRLAETNDPNRIADLEAQLAETEAAYQAMQEVITTRGAELAALVPGRSADTVLGVAQVQALLDDQTTLLAYYLLEDSLLAFILGPDRFEVVSLEVTPEDLDDQIAAFRDFADVDQPHPDSAVTLYEMLIASLADNLTTPHLAIIPHQALHYLPFAALTDGKRYLIDDYTLTLLPSASALPFIRKSAAQTTYDGTPRPLVLGNPTTADYDIVASLVVDERQYRDGLGALPFAEKEAKAIADLFGVEPLIGEAATEAAVWAQVSQANILHLAAHGQFNPVAPLNSLIALAPGEDQDGWLTVGEVYGLDLSRTDLVVLSACETNLGDLSAGDELVGLTRAFIFAGTPSVVASLWAVDDETTGLLMERFYSHLKAGLGKADALRQAQLDLREDHPNPYYWSGFVLAGDPGEIAPRAVSASAGGAAEPDSATDTTDTEPADDQNEAAIKVVETAIPEATEAGKAASNARCLSLLIVAGALGVVVAKRRRV